MKKIELIYVGRLVEEKWFDLILELCEKISNNKDIAENVHVHLFSDGPLREVLEQNLPEWDFVTYYGQQPKERLFEIRKDCTYCLMPSRFLETFGLAALDSLSLGVPVIGFAKWWLQQFIKDPKLSIENEENFGDSVMSLLGNFDQDVWEKQHQEAKRIYENYRREQWIQQFQKMSGLEPWARVLLVSDYIVDIGGIESYLWNVKALLEEHGYTVKLVGCSDEKKAKNRYKQLFGTLFNRRWATLVSNSAATFTPDVIWWHSVHRWLGRYPLWKMRTFKKQQRVMYHDFGLFHPYPSRVVNEHDLYYKVGLWWFIGSSWGGWKQQFISVFKWFSVRLLRKLLRKHCDLHLVPSSYMEDIVMHHYEESSLEVRTFPHFI